MVEAHRGRERKELRKIKLNEYGLFFGGLKALEGICEIIAETEISS